MLHFKPSDGSAYDTGLSTARHCPLSGGTYASTFLDCKRMNGLSWMAQYVHILGVLLPVFVCAGIGASWAVRKMSYPNEFISVLVTSVTTPALVFHTILTTDLHDTM